MSPARERGNSDVVRRIENRHRVAEGAASLESFFCVRQGLVVLAACPGDVREDAEHARKAHGRRRAGERAIAPRRRAARHVRHRPAEARCSRARRVRRLLLVASFLRGRARGPLRASARQRPSRSDLPLGELQSTERRLESSWEPPWQGRGRARAIDVLRSRARGRARTVRARVTALSASATRPDDRSQSSVVVEVVELTLETIHPVVLIRPGELRLGFECQARESAGRDVRARARADRPLAGDRVRTPGPSPASRGGPRRRCLASNEAPADEGLQVREEAVTSARRPRAHRREWRSSPKTASAPCKLPLLVGQALVAPVDRGAQRALALRQIDRALHLECKPFLERTHDLRGRQDDEPGRDELDRERESVEPAADLVDRMRGRRPGVRRPAPRRARRTVSSRPRARAAREEAPARSKALSGIRLVASICESGARSSSDAT